MLEGDYDRSTVNSPKPNQRSSKSEYISHSDMKSSINRGQDYPKTELSHDSRQQKTRKVKELVIMDDLTVIEIESNRVKKNNHISSKTANEFGISGKKHDINQMFEGYLMDNVHLTQNPKQN